MMALVQAPDDLRVLVGRGIRVLLAGQCDDDARVVLLVLRELVISLVGGQLDPGPLAPEVDARGCLDQFYDVGAAHARGSFEKIKMSLATPFDEFHVGYTVHQPERTDDLTTQGFQG